MGRDLNTVVTWMLSPLVFLVPQPEILKPDADVWGLMLEHVLLSNPALPRVPGC